MTTPPSTTTSTPSDALETPRESLPEWKGRIDAALKAGDITVFGMFPGSFLAHTDAGRALLREFNGEPEAQAAGTEGGPLDSKRTGFLGFTRYNDVPGPHGAWKTFDGRKTPGWDEVGPLTQARWVAAGEAERDIAFSIAGHAAVKALEDAGCTDEETLNRVQSAILRHKSTSIYPPDPLPVGAVIS